MNRMTINPSGKGNGEKMNVFGLMMFAVVAMWVMVILSIFGVVAFSFWQIVVAANLAILLVVAWSYLVFVWKGE